MIVNTLVNFVLIATGCLVVLYIELDGGDRSVKFAVVLLIIGLILIAKPLKRSIKKALGADPGSL